MKEENKRALNKIAYFLLGCTLMNLVWAINYETPFSQGVAMLKAGHNAFIIMTYFCFVFWLFCLFYQYFDNKRMSKTERRIARMKKLISENKTIRKEIKQYLIKKQ